MTHMISIGSQTLGVGGNLSPITSMGVVHHEEGLRITNSYHQFFHNS